MYARKTMTKTNGARLNDFGALSLFSFDYKLHLFYGYSHRHLSHKCYIPTSYIQIEIHLHIPYIHINVLRALSLRYSLNVAYSIAFNRFLFKSSILLLISKKKTIPILILIFWIRNKSYYICSWWLVSCLLLIHTVCPRLFHRIEIKITFCSIFVWVGESVTDARELNKLWSWSND